ncbi:MBL fold metallo-hydrolase [Halobacteriovorax sp. GB3]|uniref:MBL fold metallo-hydrolase n=1 Tax=Halobacteriovorax sp. GB3 TaxID=2719615 RepID=UPI00235F551F|nr:MBL fold metallo-hydrolase [Halobacteriovorax sp. GB3]MDD0851752.1 MBL fold metallo-hydrolase [Halobacteriovorax sp. GB3]
MKIHHLKGYIQSIYLVEKDNQLALLDGCSRADIETIESFIKNDLKLSLDCLKLVVVTHMHPDHAGAASFLKSKWGCHIAAHPKVNSWYKGFLGHLKYEIDLFLTHYVAKKMKKQKRPIRFPKKISIDFHLSDGDQLPFFPDWKALFCPGHTDCDLTLWHEKSKTAYIADNIIKIRKKIVSPYPVNYPDIYRDSLRRYLKLEIENYLLAHGGEAKIGTSEIEKFILNAPREAVNHRQVVKRVFKNFEKHNYFG